MTDSTTPALTELEEVTIETYRDGEYVGTRTVTVPKAPPSIDELQERLTRMEEMNQRLAEMLEQLLGAQGG